MGVSAILSFFCYYVTNVGVMLIGATGAGKSTLVNSWANFSQFETFDDAIEGDPVFLVPSVFPMSGTKYGTKFKTITVEYPEDNPRRQRGSVTRK
ncbi:hypothetical protein AAVH_24749 [Aphelenchoides avenae]|nr:hypothetical protein AAVH_24748 [Aphelenchus avenae]KAH7708005.1 hypothetical protein AAVH_24749 [Aphelenchus avenae]